VNADHLLAVPETTLPVIAVVGYAGQLGIPGRDEEQGGSAETIDRGDAARDGKAALDPSPKECVK
jgi:hypothetical protein